MGQTYKKMAKTTNQNRQKQIIGNSYQHINTINFSHTAINLFSNIDTPFVLKYL